MMMLSVEQAVTPKPRYSRPGAQLPTVHPGIELPSTLSVQVAAAGRNASGSSSAAMKRWRCPFLFRGVKPDKNSIGSLIYPCFYCLVSDYPPAQR
jgi:hypothetical protein